LGQGEVLIGRSRNCHIVLRDPSVSRSHALLKIFGPEIRLKDLASSNGTFVNGKRVEGETEVHAGDQLVFGETQVELLRREESFSFAGLLDELEAVPLPGEAGELGDAILETIQPRPEGMPAEPPPDPIPVPAAGPESEFDIAFSRASLSEEEPDLHTLGPVKPPGRASREADTPSPPGLGVQSMREAVERLSPAPAPKPPPAPKPSAPRETQFSELSGPSASSRPATPPGGADEELLPSLDDLDGLDERPASPSWNSLPRGASPNEAGESIPPPEAPWPAGAKAAPAPRQEAAKSLAELDRMPRPRPGPPGLEPAGLAIRWLAGFLDILLVVVVAGGVSLTVGGPWQAEGNIVFWGTALGLFLILHVFGWNLWGTSPAKGLLGLYVCPLGSGPGLPVGQALLRFLGYGLGVLTLGIGFLLIAFQDQHRGLHDLLARTYVGRRSR
jgi:uncharacterized RDD family membrane protein YckC